MAYAIPTALHAHMRADVTRVRLVSTDEADPMDTFDGLTISRVRFVFTCPEFPGEHRVIVPYDWDRDEWMLNHAVAERTIPPELYTDILTVVDRQSPFMKASKKRLPSQ